jgi:hypothetical protein
VPRSLAKNVAFVSSMEGASSEGKENLDAIRDLLGLEGDIELIVDLDKLHEVSCRGGVIVSIWFRTCSHRFFKDADCNNHEKRVTPGPLIYRHILGAFRKTLETDCKSHPNLAKHIREKWTSRKLTFDLKPYGTRFYLSGNVEGLGDGKARSGLLDRIIDDMLYIEIGSNTEWHYGITETPSRRPEDPAGPGNKSILATCQCLTWWFLCK